VASFPPDQAFSSSAIARLLHVPTSHCSVCPRSPRSIDQYRKASRWSCYHQELLPRRTSAHSLGTTLSASLTLAEGLDLQIPFREAPLSTANTPCYNVKYLTDSFSVPDTGRAHTGPHALSRIQPLVSSSPCKCRQIAFPLWHPTSARR
jgi:hypothetical protein